MVAFGSVGSYARVGAYAKVGAYANFKKPASGANPTVMSYNASIVNFYNAASSLARFESKFFILL
jgi:hypothetical protein